MKFVPLGDNPNVSKTRFDATSPSMRLDQRGFPHLTWLEKKNGHNRISYSFWDGVQWAYIQSPFIYKCEEDIIYSPNSLILDSNEKPHIAFSRKSIGGQSIIAISYPVSGEWIINELNVDYDVVWIGIQKYDRNLVLSSSSSLLESLSTSSSSSSSVNSSSSSSYDDGNIFIITYDTDGNIHIYSVTDALWREIEIKADVISDINTLKTTISGNKILFSFVNKTSSSSVIKYNFYDLDNMEWIFASFNSFVKSSTSGNILDIDIYGYNFGGEGRAYIAWLTESNILYAYAGIVSETGDETLNPWPNIIEYFSKTLISTDCLINGYRKIAVTSSNNLPYVVGSGTLFSTYSIDENVWVKNIIGIDEISDSLKPEQTAIELDDNDKCNLVFSNDFNDIYHYRIDPDKEAHDISYPDIAFLTSQRMLIAPWQNGETKLLTDIRCTYNNKTADILKESFRKSIVLVNELEDPECYTSSTSSSSYSSSSFSSSSSSFGKSSSSSSSSINYSSSSSSINYSSSSSSSIEYSSSSSSSRGYSESSSSSSSYCARCGIGCMVISGTDCRVFTVGKA